MTPIKDKVLQAIDTLDPQDLAYENTWSFDLLEEYPDFKVDIIQEVIEDDYDEDRTGNEIAKVICYTVENKEKIYLRLTGTYSSWDDSTFATKELVDAHETQVTTYYYCFNDEPFSNFKEVVLYKLHQDNPDFFNNVTIYEFPSIFKDAPKSKQFNDKISYETAYQTYLNNHQFKIETVQDTDDGDGTTRIKVIKFVVENQEEIFVQISGLLNKYGPFEWEEIRQVRPITNTVFNFTKKGL